MKPIAGRGEDHSVDLVQLGAHISPPAPITRQVAEELLAHGDDQTLMEQVVEIAGRAAKGADVLVAEGMVPEPGMVYSTRVNALMLRALDAELVLVAAPARPEPGRGGGRGGHRGARLRRHGRGPAGGLHPEPRVQRTGGAPATSRSTGSVRPGGRARAARE